MRFIDVDRKKKKNVYLFILWTQGTRGACCIQIQTEATLVKELLLQDHIYWIRSKQFPRPPWNSMFAFCQYSVSVYTYMRAVIECRFHLFIFTLFRCA